MADNTTINAGSGGDTIRDKDRSGVKTQIVALDLNPAGVESLMAGAMPSSMAAGAQADGHSATIGTTTDASTALTLVGLLKAIKAAITGTVKVDGSAVTQPVSGTFWQATQPVSGTFWQATQPVSGTVTANAGTGTMAVSSADGAQVTIGTTTDASTASTVVGVLKAIKAAVQGTLTVSGTVTANAGSGTLAVSMAAAADQASTLTNGRKTVTTAGTAVALSTSLACKWVSVTALDSNTGLVAVGGSGVLATAGSQTGTLLTAGQSVSIPVANASTVFVDARVSGEGVSFTVGS